MSVWPGRCRRKHEIDHTGMPPDRRAFTALKKYGLLLLNDPALPSLCRLVAGARVRGSWWAHPGAQEIFKVYDALEDHPDVLLLKLISRKVTYVHRQLWPQIVAIGRARELWQAKDLSTAARKLLAGVDKSAGRARPRQSRGGQGTRRQNAGVQRAIPQRVRRARASA